MFNLPDAAKTPTASGFFLRAKNYLYIHPPHGKYFFHHGMGE